MSSESTKDFYRAFCACVGRLTRDTHHALGDLFDLTAVRLVRLAMGITANQSDAEDAVQAAFFRIAGKPKLLAQANSPWPYLIRTVRNEALRILQKRRTRSLGDIDTECSHDTAEIALYRDETAQRVQDVLQRLPRAQYEVVILKHWEDLTFAEIAEVLGKSQNTVASRYRYAMEKLHRSLEHIVPEKSHTQRVNP